MKKVVSAVLVCLCMAGCSAPAAVEEAPAEAIYTAGTYSGSDRGFEGPLSVEVELSDSKIENITVTEQNETESVGGVAMEELIKAILEGQTLAVDGVSGATYSSTGLINATTKALMSAGVDVTTLGGTPIEEEPILSSAERLTETTPADAPEGVRTFNYKTDGTTCTTEFNITLNGTVIEDVEFLGDPCQGNSTGVINLSKGMKMGEVISKCAGIPCDGAGGVSSCPDQLSKGLVEILKVYQSEGIEVPLDANGEFVPNCTGNCDTCPNNQ